MLEAALRSLGLDGRRARVTPVGGGCIHDAVRVELPGGQRLFVKTNDRPLPRIFEQEAEGLLALRRAAPESLGVPEVLGVGPGWLALEWIDVGRGDAAAGRRLGVGLAGLHRETADAFGWAEDNWIGSLRQPNPRVPAERGGPAFFAARLSALLAGARRVPPSLRGRVERFCARAAELLPDEAPALVHGDLWGGNWSADRAGRPWIYDPAVHRGCREAELAFTKLFGGFPASFYAAYEGEHPLLPGWEERADLWNLYPLLVHVELFGGAYAAQAEGILRRRLG